MIACYQPFVDSAHCYTFQMKNVANILTANVITQFLLLRDE